MARSNEALEQFTYMVSHDLQEPLRVVAGFVHLLERRHAEQLPEEARELLGLVHDGVTRMKTLLDGLLELAQVQRRPVETVPVALRDIVDGVLRDPAATLSEGGIVVEVDELLTMDTDPDLLTRIIWNLVANAVKFRSPQRPPAVRITARRMDGGCRVDVTDNGIGIAADDRERVLNVFERLHSREEYPGTGMGLAIVKACVDRLGGHLGVEEAPGGGSTFWFTIPAV